MVVNKSDGKPQGQVESQLLMDQQQQHHDNNVFPQLGRQSSIYSLTIDEFQQTLCASGKNFGSMNMDEFLNSIWTAEENQAQVHPGTTTTANNTNNNAASTQFLQVENASADKGIGRQPNLSRQGSLSLPAPLCRKTVDEVWSQIQKTKQDRLQKNDNAVPNTSSSQRGPTFGEMTLEDFLVRAGVVREQVFAPQPIQQPPPYGMSYQNGNNPNTDTSFMLRPIMGVGGITSDNGGAVAVNLAGYQAISHSGMGEAQGYVGSSKRGSGYLQPGASPVSYGGRATNGMGGGYGQVQGLGLGSPVSPVSSDGMCTTQVDSSNQYGLDVGRIRGLKRIIDSPVEKVVERRQRRMIKNRESAARSRARKQAYTVELEAELNQLKEENAQLKQALAELERKRKQQQYFEEVKLRSAKSKTRKAEGKLKVLTRNVSCPY